MTLGEQIQLGPYMVRAALRPDNPAFLCYLIFKGERLIGKQFSVPVLSDCKFYDLRGGQYATLKETKADPSWQLSIPPRWKKRSRQRNDALEPVE